MRRITPVYRQGRPARRRNSCYGTSKQQLPRRQARLLRQGGVGGGHGGSRAQCAATKPTPLPHTLAAAQLAASRRLPAGLQASQLSAGSARHLRVLVQAHRQGAALQLGACGGQEGGSRSCWQSAAWLRGSDSCLLHSINMQGATGGCASLQTHVSPSSPLNCSMAASASSAVS